MPCSRQKASAPSPISNTWLDRSMAARAANTGLRGPKMTATPPARWSGSSIAEASRSCVPAAVKTLPRPALNNGSSSSATTAFVAASSALPPAARTSRPVTKARRKPSRYGAVREAVASSREIVPAPPWTASANPVSAAFIGTLPSSRFRRYTVREPIFTKVVKADDTRPLARLGLTKAANDATTGVAAVAGRSGDLNRSARHGGEHRLSRHHRKLRPPDPDDTMGRHLLCADLCQSDACLRTGWRHFQPRSRLSHRAVVE